MIHKTPVSLHENHTCHDCGSKIAVSYADQFQIWLCEDCLEDREEDAK